MGIHALPTHARTSTSAWDVLFRNSISILPFSELVLIIAQLTATVFVSILIVITTIFTVWLSGIQSPFVMVLVSLVLMIIWVANVVVLSNHLSNSESLCEDHSAGITICKLFKALFGMSITALYVRLLPALMKQVMANVSKSTSSVVGLGWDLHRLWIASCGGTPQATKIKEQELEASEV